MISTYVLDYEDAAEDCYIDNDSADLDEEDESGLGDASVRIVVTKP